MATHDYVIDNSTGANVRADINSVLQAILTNNSNSSAPSTTAAYMFWADTTNGVLKIRNSANNAWVELFQLDGTLTLEDGSASTPALAFRDDLNTGIFSSAADTFNVATGGVERMELGATTIFNESGADVNFRVEGDTNVNLLFVDAGQDRIGVNENAPLGKFHIKSTDSSVSSVNGSADELVLENNGSCGLSILSSTTNEGIIAFGDSGANSIGKISYNHSSNSLAFITNSSEAFRIDSSGRLLLGTSTARAVGGESNPRLHIEGSGNTSNSWVNLTRFQAGTAGANFQFAKARSNTPGTYTVVQGGDTLGTISFLGADGTDMANYAATISAQVDGTPGSNDMPGRLVFSTTADGAGTVTERMRIKSNGSVAIGTTNGSARLMVARDIAASASNNFDNQTVILTGTFGGNSTDNRTGLYFAPYNSSNQYCPSAISCLAGSNYQSDLAFYTNPAGNGTGHVESYERMRILSNGVVDIYSAYTNPVGGTTRDLYVRSDGRLGYLSSIRASKINIVDLTDISWLNNLKPQMFNVRKQNDLGEYNDSYYDELEYGLIAEDVESVNKELCSYSANNVLESVQYRKLVVPLLKAVQELTARVAALEAA